MFKEALKFFAESLYDDVRKANALDTLVVFLHAMLRKQFAGWELMELLAGTVSESDRVFGVSLARRPDQMVDHVSSHSWRLSNACWTVQTRQSP